MGLAKTGIKGVAWTTASIVTRSVVSLLQITILTRYLEKSEFGIVAIASVFIGFTQLFLDLGISVGIIHKQDTPPKVYSSLFWLNIMMGVVLTTILCFISPLAARMYHEPSLTKVLMLLSFGVLFSALGSQHRTMQQKKMRFQYISIVEIISSILTFCIAVCTATHGYGVYSLVYSTLFNALFSNFVFLCIGLIKDRNITFHFRLRETFPFLKIGVFSIGSNVMDYFSREIDTIIISATFGMDILGVYNLCKKIVIMLYGVVNQVLGKVMTPIFAQLQKDVDIMRNALYKVTESIALFNYPIFFLVSIFATGILNYLYGNQYAEYALVLSLMSIYYGRLSTGSASGCVQIAMGRTDVGMYWTIVRILMNALAVWIGSLISVEAIVACLFVNSILISPINWKIVISPLVGGRFWDYFLISVKPLLHVALLATPFYILFNNTINLVWIISGGVVFMLIYFVIVRCFYKNSFLLQSVLPQILKKTNKGNR